MKLHIFQSGRELDVFGFTADETGSNLPAALAPWIKSREDTSLDTGLGNTMMRDGQSGPIFAAMQKDGFYVARSETLSRDTGIPWVG
jgi:hypothetical protein